ncbi:hypothetical protein RAA17_07800 [Komagataeibacter rhaeticus]|nr:hypothetical protein [Komagataeibacter rhaeticus]
MAALYHRHMVDGLGHAVRGAGVALLMALASPGCCNPPWGR